MLTTYLEKLIHDGIANYNTAVIGGSSVGNILVRDKSFIVITDFTFYHFSDVSSAEQIGNVDNYIQRSIHQLEFSSEKSRNHYVIKSDITWLNNGGSPIPYSRGKSRFDTYLLHTSDVHINISTVPSAEVFTTNFSPIPGDTQEDVPPLGMAGLTAVRQNDLGQGVDYISLGKQREKNIPISFGYRDQFKIGYDAQSMLNNCAIADFRANGCYPILNIGYVQINKEVGKIAQGTK